MSDASDRIVAIKAVIDRVQPDAAPVLTQGEIELEVDRARLARTWEVSTAYAVGDIIVPPARNGHAYTVTQAGTSAAAIPAIDFWLPYAGYSFYDGSSSPRLQWMEAGSDRFNGGIHGAENNIYDIRRAARECWKLKARKASQFVDDGGTAFSQVYKHCMEQATMFVPFSREIVLLRY